MSFFAFAGDHIGKLVVSLGTRSLGETLKDVKTERRMARLVEDAEELAELGVAITEKEPRALPVRRRVAHLLGDPRVARRA